MLPDANQYKHTGYHFFCTTTPECLRALLPFASASGANTQIIWNYEHKNYKYSYHGSTLNSDIYVLSEKLIWTIHRLQVATDLDRVKFVDSWSEVVWITSECDIEWFQELVHSNKKILWPANKCEICDCTETAIKKPALFTTFNQLNSWSTIKNKIKIKWKYCKYLCIHPLVVCTKQVPSTQVMNKAITISTQLLPKDVTRYPLTENDASALEPQTVWPLDGACSILASDMHIECLLSINQLLLSSESLSGFAGGRWKGQDTKQ